MDKFYEGISDALILYVRMLAWLTTEPDDPPARFGQAPQPKPAGDRKSRAQAMKEKGEDVEMPPVTLGRYLVEHLFDAGPIVVGSEGRAALDWPQIESWQRQTGVRLTPWEARTVRTLSRRFLHESQLAREHDAPPPWLPPMTEERRARVSRQLAEALRGRVPRKGLR